MELSLFKVYGYTPTFYFQRLKNMYASMSNLTLPKRGYFFKVKNLPERDNFYPFNLNRTKKEGKKGVHILC